MKELKKYHCRVDKEDYLTVDIVDKGSVYAYIQIFNLIGQDTKLIEGEYNEGVLGLSKDQAKELIKELQSRL